MDWIWIGFGFNISELNGYGLDLELESSPSGTSGHNINIILNDCSNISIQISLIQLSRQNQYKYSTYFA